MPCMCVFGSFLLVLQHNGVACAFGVSCNQHFGIDVCIVANGTHQVHGGKRISIATVLVFGGLSAPSGHTSRKAVRASVLVGRAADLFHIKPTVKNRGEVVSLASARQSRNVIAYRKSNGDIRFVKQGLDLLVASREEGTFLNGLHWVGENVFDNVLVPLAIGIDANIGRSRENMEFFIGYHVSKRENRARNFAVCKFHIKKQELQKPHPLSQILFILPQTPSKCNNISAIRQKNCTLS